MVGPIDDRGRSPDALVLIASPSLGTALRRARESGWAGPVVVVGDRAEACELAHRREPAPGVRPRLLLDPDRRTVVSGERQADLTPLEYDVLHALLVEPGQVCPFAELTEQVWGTPYDGDTAQVHSVVKRVRRKLDAIASPMQVQAVRGVGFRAIVRTTRPRGR